MRKAFYGAVAYILIGGAIAGLAVSDQAQKCGGSVASVDSTGYATTVLLWPAMSATAAVTSFRGTKFDSTCKIETPRTGA